VQEVKDALTYYQNSKKWQIRYAHSLVPNVGPVYKDVYTDPEFPKNPIFEAKKKTSLYLTQKSLQNI
jgi:hypothetical protein